MKAAAEVATLVFLLFGGKIRQIDLHSHDLCHEGACRLPRELVQRR